VSVAAIRPDDWNLPLFLHLLGAMVTVGALVTAAYYLFAARRTGSLDMVRTGFRTLLWVALPAFVVLRVAAQWLLDKEGLEDSEDAWIGIGFTTTDIGLLFLIIATVLTGLAVRRAGRAQAGAQAPGTVGTGTTVAAWLTGVLIVAYTVAIWAMATKPV